MKRSSTKPSLILYGGKLWKTSIPVYYLEIDTKTKISYYRICGQRTQILETALKETCRELNIAYREPLIEC